MKKTEIIGLSILVLSLMVTYQTSAALSPYVGISVGDKFQYEFTQFEIYRYINGSLILDINGSNLIDNSINITINDISESNDAFFENLYGSSTEVNVTENFKRGSFMAKTLLDMWFFHYYETEIGFDSFITYFDPEEGINGEITPPDTSDYSNFAGLPVLATTNKSFYEALEQEVPDYSGTPPMPPDRLLNEKDRSFTLNNRQTQASLQDGIFKMNVTNIDTRSGETSANESWSITGGTAFYTEINTIQGLVNILYWKIYYSTVIGETTDNLIYEIQIENLNQEITHNVSFQFYLGLITLILGLIVFRRRK